MQLVINGLGVISSIGSFTGHNWPQEKAVQAEHEKRCVDPDFKEFIPAAKLRRMSTILRRGGASAKMALNDAGIETPDAITVGTGLGCLEDTVKFMEKMDENKEQFLNPSPFIQSTHNAVSGQIALLLQCHGHNFTFVHGGHSFECALLDAQLFIEENPGSQVLCGGIDEINPSFYDRMKKRGRYWKDEKHLDLPIPGEGAIFFVLSDRPGENCYGKLEGLKTTFTPAQSLETHKFISEFLHETQAYPGKIDYLLSGEIVKNDVVNPFAHECSIVENYKYFCGEYHTASAFGLAYMAAFMSAWGIGNWHALQYNQWQNRYHSLFLFSKC